MQSAVDIEALNQQAQSDSAFIEDIRKEANQVIVGQTHMMDRLLLGLLSDGHILLEGLPGLAKTLAIKTLSSIIDVSFNRIQFTPDLLPADILGTMIFNQKTNEFSIRKGPIFSNFILADEINRAPAKVQSALLESMQERQVTIGKETFRLDEPFLVLATQNPIEQEGTYDCIFRSEIVWVNSNNLSDKVLLPWSICAITQKFLIFFIVCKDTFFVNVAKEETAVVTNSLQYWLLVASC